MPTPRKHHQHRPSIQSLEAICAVSSLMPVFTFPTQSAQAAPATPQVAARPTINRTVSPSITPSGLAGGARVSPEPRQPLPYSLRVQPTIATLPMPSSASASRFAIDARSTSTLITITPSISSVTPRGGVAAEPLPHGGTGFGAVDTHVAESNKDSSPAGRMDGLANLPMPIISPSGYGQQSQPSKVSPGRPNASEAIQSISPNDSGLPPFTVMSQDQQGQTGYPGGAGWALIYEPDTWVTTYHYSIDWGDGSPGATGVIYNSHTYNHYILVEEYGHVWNHTGTYGVNVNVWDDYGRSGQCTTMEVISDQALGLGAPESINTYKDVQFHDRLDYFFDWNYKTDSPSDNSAKITLSDGTVAQAQILNTDGVPRDNTIFMTATFNHTGTFLGTLEVDHTGLPPQTKSFYVTVTQPPVQPNLVADPVPAISATATQSFNGLVAAFHDTNQSPIDGGLNAVIKWGDGQTSTGTINSLGSGKYTVTGTNTYAEGGTFPVSVTILNGSTEEDIANGDPNGFQIDNTATVADAGYLNVYYLPGPPPIGGGGVGSGPTSFASDAAPFDGIVARFTDSDPNATPAKYTTSIDFGDGGGPVEGYVAADPYRPSRNDAFPRFSGLATIMVWLPQGSSDFATPLT